LIAQGMPSEFSEQVWRYGFSMVYFENGRLTKWYESPATPLRIKAQAAKSSTKPKEFFMIGSTKDDVLNVQGTPTQFTDDVWRYGSSMVYFEGGHVANCYNSPANPIKARLDAVPAPNTEKRYFTLGSSKEEVLAIQGVPTQFTETVWLYGSSRVSFENDRVVSWYESPTNPLNAHMEQANLTQ
ncbi:MAG: hypothetical protein HY708_04830, partial [Ignavibacteriae bacterium]|nr:hypothetical protein [Ignavibacteriota bacterium]